MGFDNECILNIQSLPGEYFCPVCRTLVYPNEAFQTQCTHLYCKQCFDYTVAYTRVCPYDTYPVTAADSKPLIESNKSLAETIGKVVVHCLYHRSGCQWQGTFSECLTHCSSCTFGDSPVVCNRCGTQILHREVQEHAQKCPALQPQGQQQTETVQAQPGTSSVQDQSAISSSATQAASSHGASVSASAAPNAAASLGTAPAVAAVAAASVPLSAAATLPAASAQGQGQANVTSYMQTVAHAPTPQQWYQQYQQYYQQYPGYDPYQQQYQQYAQYQQAYAQYAQPQMLVAPQHVIQGQQQQYMQPQVQAQSQVQVQPQIQPQPQPQAQAQPQPQPQAQPQPHAPLQLQLVQQQQHLLQPQLPVQSQAQAVHPRPSQQQVPPTQPQLQPHANAQVALTQHPRPNIPTQQPYPHGQQQTHALAGPPAQSLLQPHPQTQGHQQLQLSSHQPSLQPHMQPHPQQQPLMQAQQQVHSSTLPTMQVQQPQMQPQPHVQTHQQPQPQLIVQPQPQPLSVTGHQSYSQAQVLPQTQPGAPTQRPMLAHSHQPGMPYQHPPQPVQMQNQFPPQQAPQLRPLQGNMVTQMQQQPVALQQGSHISHLPHHQPNYLQHQGHGQQLQHYVGMQSQVPQQTLPHLQSHGYMHPDQPHPQGLVPSQQQFHQYGQPSMLQQVPPGLITHQAQSAAARPSVVNQGQLQQPPHHSIDGPAKLVQPGYTQQGPTLNQRLTGQLSHLPESVKQGPELSAFASKGIENTEAINLDQSQAELSASADMNKRLQFKTDGEAATEDVKVSNVDTEKVKGEGHQSGTAEDESLEVKSSKQSIQAVSDLPDNKHLGLYAPKDGMGDGVALNASGELNNKSNEQADHHSRGHTAGDSTIERHASQQQPYSGDKIHLQQPSQQGAATSLTGRALLQSGFHDKASSQVSRQGTGPDMPHGLPPAGLISGQEKYPPQAVPHGHPSNLQQFPQQQIPQTGQFEDRRFQEPLPYQLQARGPTMAPGQMRPPVHNVSGPFPNQPPFVPEPLQPMSAHPGIPGAAFSLVGSTGNLGLAPKNIGEQGLHSQVQGPSNMSLHHAGSARAFPGEPRMRPPIDGPPFGVADRPSGMMQRGPPFGMDDRINASRLTNNSEMESIDTRRPVFADGKQLDPNVAHASMVNANGGPDERFRQFPEEGHRATQDGTLRPFPLDSGRHAVTRREFEEDLKQFPRPAHLEGEGLRRFDDYSSSSKPLSRGQGQLGPDSVPRRFDTGPPGPFGLGTTSDPHMRDTSRGHRAMPYVEDFSGNHDQLRPGKEFGRHGMDGLPPLRSPGREYGVVPSGKFALGSKSRVEDLDSMESHERSKASSLQTDLAGDSKLLRPPIMGPGAMPGHFMRGHPDGFGSMRKDLDARDTHMPFTHGDPLGHGFSGNVHGHEMFGSRNMPRLFPGGDPLGPNRPGFGGSFPFSDFPREAGPFGSLPVHGDIDAFEHSRKRKPGSNCWCLICKVDCETLEGLDLHSQTSEHQKIAMDVVISIKKENVKKKRGSEVNKPPETKKRRKMGYDGHGKKQ